MCRQCSVEWVQICCYYLRNRSPGDAGWASEAAQQLMKPCSHGHKIAKWVQSWVQACMRVASAIFFPKRHDGRWTSVSSVEGDVPLVFLPLEAWPYATLHCYICIRVSQKFTLSENLGTQFSNEKWNLVDIYMFLKSHCFDEFKTIWTIWFFSTVELP